MIKQSMKSLAASVVLIMAVGCATSAEHSGGTNIIAKESLHEFKTSWGVVFVAGKKEEKNYLKIRGPETSAELPSLINVVRLNSKYISSNLSEGHKIMYSVDGDISAVYRPDSSTLYFAFRAKGNIDWFGHQLGGDLTFLSSMKSDGEQTKWYFNAFGAGAKLSGVRQADEFGWIERLFVSQTDYKAQKTTPFRQKLVLHSASRKFILNIYPGAIMPSEGIMIGPNNRYRVQGYFGTATESEDNDNPFLPKQQLLIVVGRIAK